MMNPTNGKGSKRRKGANDTLYSQGWDRIFGVRVKEKSSTMKEGNPNGKKKAD